MADGGEEVTRLVYEFDARFDRLESKLNGITRSVHGKAKEIEESFANINIGKALDRVFDSSRLAVIDAGAERLRVFGSALEPLGALGIAAGAGLAAFGAGLELAEKTGEWATELGHLSEKLGLTAEQVQRYDYVWTASGVGIDKGREALSHLNEVLGQAQAGILRPQALKAFQALGFSQRQLMSFHDAGEFLDALAAKMGTLGDAAERAGLAKRLGIEALVPLLHEGAGGLAELEAKVASYAVMSNQAVDHAKELNNQLETAKLRVHEAALAVGSDMQPALIGLNKLLLGAIQGFHNLWDAVAKGQSTGDQIAQQMDIATRAQFNASKARNGTGDATRGADLIGHWAEDWGPGGRQGYIQRQEKIAREALANAATLAARQRAEDKPEAESAGVARALLPAKSAGGRGPRSPRDDFGGLNATASEKLDEAQNRYAEAMASMTEDVVAKANFEKKGIAEELAKQEQELQAAQEKVNADKGISAAKKEQLTRTLAAAQLASELTALAKTELVDRKTAQTLRDQAMALSDQEITNQVDLLKSEEATAVGSKAKLSLALQIFDLEEQLLKAKLEEVIASTETTENQKKIAKLQLQGLEATEANRRGQVADRNGGPLARYTQTLSDETGAGISDSLQSIEVKGLQDLNSGLAKAIVNAKDFGQAFSSALRQIETDLINLALEKYLTLPLAQALGLANGGIGSLFGGSSLGGVANSSLVSDSLNIGFSSLLTAATGTDYSPGGMTLVGENGPEILNVPKGAQVIPNNLIGAAGVPAGAAGAGSSIYIDNRGAVMTQDLIDNMNQAVAAAEKRATMNGAALGVQAARSLIPTEMSRRASLQIR